MKTIGARHVSGALVKIALAALMVLPAASAQSTTDLESVLKQMDATSANFRTADANFTWMQYNALVNDVDLTQKGKIYFRRTGKGIQMSADFTEPDVRQVIFADGKVQVYQPKTEIVDVYDASAHRDEFESFLVLGFGGGGHDMQKSFEVKYLGEEKVDGVTAAKLDLIPKSASIKNHFEHILLWIDPRLGLSVQQKLFETSGDYRLAKYSEIRTNQKLNETVFKLKTSGRTKTVNH